jgi:NitT/TauT family transport system substrate-binding protein
VGAARRLNISVLGGVHSGCTEIFARDSIENVSQLRTIAVPFGDSATESDYAFMLSIMNYIGLPPDRVVGSYNPTDLPRLLQSGDIDGAIAIAPGGEELRGLDGVRVLVRTADDPPWSTHYCCVVYGNATFVERNPNTTRRTMRALYRAIDATARQPEDVARHIVEVRGYPFSLEDATHHLKHPHFDVWRTFDVEDTLRFYALRLREVGEIDATPDEILEHVDLRYFNELRGKLAAAPRRFDTPFALTCEVQAGEYAAAIGPRRQGRS